MRQRIINFINQYLWDYVTKTNIELLLLALAVAVGFYMSWQISHVIVLAIIVRYILRPFRTEDIAKFALIALLLTVAAVAVNRQSYAELLAAAAFLLWAFSVLIANFAKRSDET